MSPRTGRPTENPKSARFEVRLTKDTAGLLNDCADRLKATKTEVIEKGIHLVKAELDKQEKKT